MLILFHGIILKKAKAILRAIIVPKLTIQINGSSTIADTEDEVAAASRAFRFAELQFTFIEGKNCWRRDGDRLFGRSEKFHTVICRKNTKLKAQAITVIRLWIWIKIHQSHL